MNSPRMDQLLKFLSGIQPAMALFWLGLAIFTAGLAVLLYTRWGQYRPLRKCMAMSLLAHLLLACYAATIQIIAPCPPPPEPIIDFSIADEGDSKGEAGGGAPGLTAANAPADERPWESFAAAGDVRPEKAELRPAEIAPPATPSRLVRVDSPGLPGGAPLDGVALDGAAIVAPNPAIGNAVGSAAIGPAAEKIEVPPPRRRDAPPAAPAAPAAPNRLAGDALAAPERGSGRDAPTALLQRVDVLPPPADGDDLGSSSPGSDGATGDASPRPLSEVIGSGAGSAAGGDSAHAGEAVATDGAGGGTRGNSGSAGSGGSGGPNVGLYGPTRAGSGINPYEVPNAYRLRVAPDRAGVARTRGGSTDTEAAVKAALKWLADNQDADGRWNPRTQGGGKETKVLGRDRQSAGSHADAAVTGLALLAFLASGNTHLDGPYDEDVRRGLEYLLRTQAADGNLGGDAAAFEFMYCHAMAACALSEAYGMTRDDRLREPVRRAIAYTIAAQDPAGGGWRYRPGDAGDTSQLGWQLMALKSAELAGIPTPEKTRQGIIRYLRSVSSGKHGGLASYRPGEKPSRPMSAEALVCWQFLGLSRQHPACNEAGDYLLEDAPGEGEFNLYYWYYATLGMYQLQGGHWQRWNEAMRNELAGRQVKEGQLAGSWNTDSVWGGYGGRVYTTALATLTLEVYYRFLPLYAEVARRGE